MKKLILLTAVIFMLTAASGFAGEEKGHHEKGAKKGETAEKRIEKMTKDLGLSAEQAAQLKAIMATKMEKKKAIHEEIEKRMEAIHEEYNTSLKSILTPEQLKKYEARKEEKKEMFEHKRHNHMHEEAEGKT